MLIGYFKGQPTEYVFKHVAGSVVAEGAGLSFFYLQHNTQIVAVPTSSQDASFVFNEVTNNFQEVTIQGQLSYQIANPKHSAKLLNFSIDPKRRTYVSDDPDKLAQRICNVVQIETRVELQKRTMEQSLREGQQIAAEVHKRLTETKSLDDMGVELLSVYFLAVRPSPEVGKALEADYRETLLRKADEAIAARRAAAVDDERKIKEKQLASDRAIEEGRHELIKLQGESALREAENRGRALQAEAVHSAKAAEMNLAVYRDLDSRKLLALAMKEIGNNAERVGNLTITTEVLSGLLHGAAGGDR